MELYFKSSYICLSKTDEILIKKKTYFKTYPSLLQVFSFDSSPSLLHPLVFLDIVHGFRPKLISQSGGQLRLPRRQFYYYFYLFYLEILPKQNSLFVKQINLKQHVEFDNFQKFYIYFYAQKSFYFQYQFID
jgi:hypothetical protein